MNPRCFVCGFCIGSRAYTDLASRPVHTPECFNEALAVAQAALASRYPQFGEPRAEPAPLGGLFALEAPEPVQRSLQL